MRVNEQVCESCVPACVGVRVSEGVRVSLLRIVRKRERDYERD